MAAMMPQQETKVGGLVETLRERVAETVRSVCSGFEQELGQSAQQRPRAAAAAEVGAADEEVYYACCRRLVAYVTTHMATSPDFVEQMDRIILASHCGTPERLLNLVVTEDLWLCRRGSESESNRGSTSANSTHSNRQGPCCNAGLAHSAVHGTRQSEGAVACAASAPTACTISPEVEVIDVDDSDDADSPVTSNGSPPEIQLGRPATDTPSVQSGGGKKRASATWSSQKIPLSGSKRPRRAVARVLLGGKASAKDNSRTEIGTENSSDSLQAEAHATSDADGAEVVEVRSTAGSSDDERQDVTKSGSFVLEKEEGDGRVSTKDTFGKLIHAAYRTPQQSKLYKSRLRNCIRIVDARACKPPRGKVCTQNCDELRAQLCYGSEPCSNKMCRLWHEAEAHTGWCQGSKCEFKNRLYLRDVLHKIEHKQASYEKMDAEVEEKKKELQVVQETGTTEEEELVWSKILELERGQDNEYKELRFLKNLKETFWTDLRSIGIEPWNDAIDNFPDFASHYAIAKGD